MTAPVAAASLNSPFASVSRAKPVGNPLSRSGSALTGPDHGLQSTETAKRREGLVAAMGELSMDLAGPDGVVLSACQTGLGEIRQGEGVYGLTRAFQKAGIKAVPSPRWSADDEATQDFMERFCTFCLSDTQLKMVKIARILEEQGRIVIGERKRGGA